MAEEDAPQQPSAPLWKRVLLGSPKDGKKKERKHPYAHEKSPAAETDLDPKTVTYTWLGVSTLMLFLGLALNRHYSPTGADAQAWVGWMTDWTSFLFSSGVSDNWETWTLVPLFSGLALLGFGFNRQTWSKRLTMGGWVLFAFYWGLVANDLFVHEDQDYFNFFAAMFGVYFFSYLAYHQWLSLVREVENHGIHFLNVTAFIAAGTYFIIAKITVLRVWLINVVGNHTKWMLDLFGQGEKKNIQFIVDKEDSQGPVTFFYPEKYCNPYRSDQVGQYCAENDYPVTSTTLPEPSNLWEQMLFYAPDASDVTVLPVSIILACTAIQSIMLFVGLFMGTEAPLKKKLQMSLIVGAVVYILNLVRNTGIIWFYGQGHASFWVMHNAIGKGGSLLAMIAIALVVFRFFPEFLKSMVAVIDLIDRDGPIERTFNLGRRRPELAIPAGAAAAGIDASAEAPSEPSMAGIPDPDEPALDEEQ